MLSYSAVPPCARRPDAKSRTLAIALALASESVATATPLACGASCGISNSCGVPGRDENGSIQIFSRLVRRAMRPVSDASSPAT